MGLLAERTGERIIKAEPIDTVVRNRPAVELIYETSSQRFAFEHTRIESFPKQIADGKQFSHLLEPLETELSGQLPGAFFLIVDAGVAKARAADSVRIRKALAEWILANAGGLDPEERTGRGGNCCITAMLPGVPFQATLHRDSDYESRLFLMQGLVGDLQRLRRARIAEALARKCPKLQMAHNDGCVSVLILESDDIALANRVVVAEATVAELARRGDAPDVLVWDRTSTNPWKCSFIKDGERLYPDIDAGILFDLNSASGAA